MDRQRAVATIILLSISASCALAKPYYFFQETGEAIPKAAGELGGQVQQAAGQVQGAINGDASKGPIPQRIGSHLGQLYTHGSSAIKGVADTVHPDLKNIGQDVADAYNSAKENVHKKIEPLAQTVRPYIEHAQKAVVPLVNQAREEIPRALGKVGEQVQRTWEKLTSGQQANGNPTESAAGQIQQAGEQIQHTATNAIKQSDQIARDAAQKVGA